MQTLKILAVTTAGAIAVLAVTVAGASGDSFQALEYPAEISSQQEGSEGHVLTAEAGLAVECKSATLTGELSEPLEEFEVSPSYGECTYSGIPATVTIEGCKYRLDANASDVDVVCPAGKAIKVVVGTCEVQVGSQNNITSIEYVNNLGPPRTVSAKSNLEAIKYNKTKDGFLCPLAGTGEKEDGTLTGETLVKAFKGEVEVGGLVGPFCTPVESSWPEENCTNWEATESEEELEEGWESEEEEWPEEEGSPEEEEAAGRDPVLFVHGIFGGIGTFETMYNRFIADGWPKSRLHNWKYRWWWSNKTIASSVEAQVAQLKKASKANEVDVVTHSMGALSSRWYLKNLGGTVEVEDWISLGGPNHGTIVALGCPGFLVSCLETLPGSSVLTNLNTNETPAGARYWTWRSPCDLVILPEWTVELKGATNTKTGCLTHSALHEDKKVYEEVRTAVEK